MRKHIDYVDVCRRKRNKLDYDLVGVATARDVSELIEKVIEFKSLWGDFKGDPDVWMERYFDAFVYLANWGSRQFSMRLPAELRQFHRDRKRSRPSRRSPVARGATPAPAREKGSKTSSAP